MAAAFDAADWGSIAGWWHDLGKYAPEFQAYLKASSQGLLRRGEGPVHAQAGALHAVKCLGPMGRALAIVIAGHHAGLADQSGPTDASLDRSLRHPKPESLSAIRHAPVDVLRRTCPAVPDRFAGPDAGPVRGSLFIRMLFSCLVDADRLATEAFYSPDIGSVREGRTGPDHRAMVISTLRSTLDTTLDRMREGPVDAPVIRRVREALLQACRERAVFPPGLFSLTAPTGAGKTLSSMAFALRHAELHGLRRVVYAMPFTSVTEQNADVFRGALRTAGNRVVIEHHSASPPPPESDSADDQLWRRLAVENWDAPIVVTTNVQLFESLFAAHPSTCRKLHRLAGSVIVLDEVQSLPVHLLKPTLAALRELAAGYGASIVLCSATMPAVIRREGFDIGLDNVREIVPNPSEMARDMRRAEISRIGTVSDDQLAERIARAGSVLTIVNTRRHAARLYAMAKERVPRDGGALIHLSALMCPEHRKHRVEEIKARLKGGLPCRVVSTQVVEAGVDIDFPLVMRAMAGLDSIIQAAGRCNREGKLDRGRVLVFDTDEEPPPGVRRAAGHAAEVLQDGVEPLELSTVERYFQLHYWSRASEWDGGPGVRITDLLRQLLFRQAAEAYRMIEDGGSMQVVVPYEAEGTDLCSLLERDDRPGPDVLRRAQRYSVNAPIWQVRGAMGAGICVESPSGPVVLRDPTGEHYLSDLGLVLGDKASPEGLMA